jgi:hypothetical protein
VTGDRCSNPEDCLALVLACAKAEARANEMGMAIEGRLSKIDGAQAVQATTLRSIQETLSGVSAKLDRALEHNSGEHSRLFTRDDEQRVEIAALKGVPDPGDEITDLKQRMSGVETAQAHSTGQQNPSSWQFWMMLTVVVLSVVVNVVLLVSGMRGFSPVGGGQ